MWIPLGSCLAALPAKVIPFPDGGLEAAADEAALVRAARSGARRAQQLLYVRHVAAVHACVARLLGRSAEADDVVQDAFVAAFADLRQLSDPERFGPWLRGIAVHQVHRRLRRRRLLQRLGFSQGNDDVTLASAIDPAADPFTKTMLSQIDTALGRIAPPLRIAWMLRHVEGHSLEEVAQQCAVSLATVKRHLGRAERQLREQLGLEPTSPEARQEEL